MFALLKNLWGGLRLALFLRAERQDFVVSWGALIAALFISVGAQFVIESVIFYERGEFNQYWWHSYHCAVFVCILFASYCIAALFRETDKVLTVAVLFFYSFLFVLIPYYIIFADYWSWMSDDISQAIHMLILAWGFLVIFRIIGMNFPVITEKQVAGALTIPVVLYVLNTQFYLSHFYYSYSDESEEVQTAFQKLTDEEVFSTQQDALEKAFEPLQGSKKGTVDLYGVTLGTYSYQDVFMREAKYVTQTLEDRLKMGGRIVTLINNEDTFFDTPVASKTNLDVTLKRISTMIQPNEDVLVLYLTSHGTAESGLAVRLSHHTMLDLSGDHLAQVLKESGIKHKVLIISACFSGSLIDAIKDDNTMIITSAAKNKQSYGCSDEADLTYFADAYFKQGLSQTTNLEAAFEIAKKYVEEREKKEKLETASDPQIFIGQNIEKHLRKYKKVKIVE